MQLKYVRHDQIGFILWPRTDKLWHSHVGQLLMRRGSGEIISAGFVDFGRSGMPRCFGMSESLQISSRPDDSAALADQLGIKYTDLRIPD